MKFFKKIQNALRFFRLFVFKPRSGPVFCVKVVPLLLFHFKLFDGSCVQSHEEYSNVHLFYYRLLGLFFLNKKNKINTFETSYIELITHLIYRHNHQQNHIYDL